jgi:hypothetical protein
MGMLWMRGGSFIIVSWQMVIDNFNLGLVFSMTCTRLNGKEEINV